MHLDPLLSDAFQALISGKKWWVSLPKDLYEFREEFMCDSSCSDVPNNFHRIVGVWFIHIMPQIRYDLKSKRIISKVKINMPSLCQEKVLKMLILVFEAIMQ